VPKPTLQVSHTVIGVAPSSCRALVNEFRVPIRGRCAYESAARVRRRALQLHDGNEVGYPNWSHDGKYLYYDTSSETEPGFYRVRISDRKTERITMFENTHRVSWLFGCWSGLALMIHLSCHVT
jgi:hypothetical protein